MAFNADFWVAAAASAPVIALAALLPARDALAAGNDLIYIYIGLPSLDYMNKVDYRRARRCLSAAYYVALYNFVAQTVVLGLSLAALSGRHDVGVLGWTASARWLVIVLECIGVAALLIDMWLGVWAGRLVKILRDGTKENERNAFKNISDKNG